LNTKLDDTNTKITYQKTSNDEPKLNEIISNNNPLKNLGHRESLNKEQLITKEEPNISREVKNIEKTYKNESNISGSPKISHRSHSSKENTNEGTKNTSGVDIRTNPYRQQTNEIPPFKNSKNTQSNDEIMHQNFGTNEKPMTRENRTYNTTSNIPISSNQEKIDEKMNNLQEMMTKVKEIKNTNPPKNPGIQKVENRNNQQSRQTNQPLPNNPQKRNNNTVLPNENQKSQEIPRDNGNDLSNLNSSFIGNQEPKVSVVKYALTISSLFLLVISVFVYQSWHTLIKVSEIFFWALILVAFVVVFPLFSSKLGKYSFVLSFGLGYLFHILKFEIWWIIIYGITIMISPAIMMNKKLLSVENTPLSRRWFNKLASTILFSVTGLEVPSFDIGNTYPEFSTQYLTSHEKRPTGFDSVVTFNYNTTPDTNLTIKIPINVPGYGEVKVPVSVSGPRLEGKVRLDCRIENCTYEFFDPEDEERKKTSDQFIAIGLAFDKIETIHFENIQVMNAPKFGWLQSFSSIKQKIHSLINGALSTEDITVLLFDSKMGLVGSITKKRIRSFVEEGEGYIFGDNNIKVCNDDNWNVQEIVSEIVICHKCKKKALSMLPTCCNEVPNLEMYTY